MLPPAAYVKAHIEYSGSALHCLYHRSISGHAGTMQTLFTASLLNTTVLWCVASMKLQAFGRFYKQMSRGISVMGKLHLTAILLTLAVRLSKAGYSAGNYGRYWWSDTGHQQTLV